MTKISISFKRLLIPVTLFFFSLTLHARTVTVTSVNALQSAISNAGFGDTLILANGTYLNNTLNIGKSNITVKAQTPGGVFLNGTNDININGNAVVFSGFQFTSGDIGTAYLIEVYGSNNKLTQLNFSGYFAKKYIEVKAGTQFNEISYCNIEKKPAAAEIGCTIQISTSPTVPGYHKIRYCSFQNYYGIGGDNGNEPVRIGLGAEALNISRTVVEYCFFNNTGLGDGETVSIKCRENVVRYSTFTNQQNAMLSFRNGDNNVAYSNFFINAGGIRVKEANNIYCYNNYFENSGVGSTADATTFVYYTANTTNVLNNVNFIHNTYVNCGYIDLGGTGATNNTWANNIFTKTSGSIFKNANAGTTWVGNIRQGSLGITISAGMSNINPLLTANSDGYQGLSATSPAIDAANTNYLAILDIENIDDDPSLLLDISGQSRPSAINLKDVGCDEFTTGTTTNHPLVVSEVGPSYLGGPLLPIKLLTFDAILQNNTVLLNWVTSFEQNSQHFEIQKSNDGISFSTIGNVAASASNSSNKAYTFSDMSITENANYYRLKMVDNDGSFSYSPTKLLNLNLQSKFSVYPNPAKNSVNFSFSKVVAQVINIKITDTNGRVVKYQTYYQPLNVTSTIFSSNISDLQNGLYHVQIVAGDDVKNIKLIVQK